MLRIKLKSTKRSCAPVRVLQAAACSLFLPLLIATTFIVKEGDVEVGRYEELDGKDAAQIVQFSESAGPSAADPPARGAGAPAQAASFRETYPWYEGRRGYQNALEVQSRTGKPIALYFHASWCPYCRAFEKKVLNTFVAGDFLKSVIRVKIDTDKEKDLKKKFAVDAIPRFFVYARDKSVRRLRTDVSAPEFIEECRRAGLTG